MIHRTVAIPRPPIPRTLRMVRARALNSTPDIVTMSHYVGEAITLFVGFYCGLQWLHYKSMVDEIKKNKNDKK